MKGGDDDDDEEKADGTGIIQNPMKDVVAGTSVDAAATGGDVSARQPGIDRPVKFKLNLAVRCVERLREVYTRLVYSGA